MNSEIKIYISGDKEGIDEGRKKVLMEALNNEQTLISESEEILKNLYKKSNKEFESFEAHFQAVNLNVYNYDYSISFIEKDKKNMRLYTIYFKNKKAESVFVDF